MENEIDWKCERCLSSLTEHALADYTGRIKKENSMFLSESIVHQPFAMKILF